MPRNKHFPEALVAQALDDALAAGKAIPVLAISGLQGSGKSTLAAQVVDLARQRGLHAAALSIDDFYLTRAQRQRLANPLVPSDGTLDLPTARTEPAA